MNIAVFCSSSNRINKKYKELAFSLGNYIAQNNHVLVYGGATGGLMDAVADGAHDQNGEIIGVIPKSIIELNRQSAFPSQIIEVGNMSERKARMQSISDIFIVLPGSYGTMDEMMDVISAGIVGEHNKKIIVINQDGFYNHLLKQIELMQKESFIPAKELYSPIIVSTLDQCTSIIHIEQLHFLHE